MKRLRLLAAVTGSACTVLAGALALAGPASAAPVSPHPRTAVAPRAGQVTTTTLTVRNTTAVGEEANVEADATVTGLAAQPVTGGTMTLRTFLADGTRVDLCSGPVANGAATCDLTASGLPTGSYQLTAHYGGVLRAFEASDSASKPLTVTTQPVSVGLETANSTLAYGQEGRADEFILSVDPRTGGMPTGTVDVGDNGAAPLCSNTLAFVNGEASAACGLTDTQLTPGTYTIFGFYNGDSTFARAGTGSQALTITPGEAVATLTVPQRIAFSQQAGKQLTVDVNPARSGNPTGSVTIKDGTDPICSMQLNNGTATCSLTARELAIGSHQLVASYGGDSNFARTTTSANLTITREPTSTALTLSTSKVKAGHEQAERLTVKVTPKFTGTPAGKVTIKAGATTVCVITLSHAKGGCTLGKSKLRPGTYHLTATYAGTTSFAGSASTKKTLTVTK